MEGGDMKKTTSGLFVDVEDTPENAAFFQQFKMILKERFRQIDIWIISHEIRIT